MQKFGEKIKLNTNMKKNTIIRLNTDPYGTKENFY